MKKFAICVKTLSGGFGRDKTLWKETLEQFMADPDVIKRMKFLTRMGNIYQVADCSDDDNPRKINVPITVVYGPITPTVK